MPLQVLSKRTEFRRAKIMVAVLTAATLAVLWLATVEWLLVERRTALDNAREDLQRLAVAMSEQVHRLFTTADVFLGTLETVISESVPENGRALTHPTVVRLVEELRRHTHGGLDVRFVDPGGGLHYMSDGASTPPLVDVSDRDYFREAVIGRMTISRPVLSRVSGRWGLPASRRLARPTSDVAVVYTSIEHEYLHHLFKTVRLPNGGSLALERRDGVLLARDPPVPSMLGTSLADGPVFTRGLPRGCPGSLEARSPVDNEDRLLAYYCIEPYGLIMVATARRDAVLEPWHTRVTLATVGATLVSIVILLGAALVVRLLGKLRLNAEELEQRVAERTAELLSAKQRAEEAAAVRGHFLATVSHELRTPLNAIIGFSDAMGLGIFGALSDRYREYAASIHDSGLHLLALVNDLLDTASVDAGKLPIHPSELDPAQLAGEAAAMVAPKAQAQGVSVTVGALPRHHVLTADRRRIFQVLLNLLSNAIKFTDPGGSVRIELVTAADGALKFVVSDTGIGMTEEEMSVALQPFGRADSAIARSREGTGLGLSLSKGLVEAHGGTLTLESFPGSGTTVTVTLPAERVRTVSSPADGASAPV